MLEHSAKINACLISAPYMHNIGPGEQGYHKSCQDGGSTRSGTPDAAAHYTPHLRGVHSSVPEADCSISSAEGHNWKWICKDILMYNISCFARKEASCFSVPT